MDLQRAMKIINFFRPMIHHEDANDFRQDVVQEMLERGRQNGGFSDKDMWLSARCVRNRYWRAYKRGNRLISLNVKAGAGADEFQDLIPDDTAPDQAAQLDARAQLLRCPPRVLTIAAKLVSGLPITIPERKCLWKFSRKMGKPPKKFVPILGERVKEQRQKLGWNRAELARRSHVPRTTIVCYETGQVKRARTDFVEKLAAALGVLPSVVSERAAE